MHITLFGANGKVGQLVLTYALEQGHTVTVFVHSQPQFALKDGISVRQGDVHDKTAVQAAVAGSDAVISTLGSWGTPAKDILTSGMQHGQQAAASRAVAVALVDQLDAHAAYQQAVYLHRN